MVVKTGQELVAAYNNDDLKNSSFWGRKSVAEVVDRFRVEIVSSTFSDCGYILGRWCKDLFERSDLGVLEKMIACFQAIKSANLDVSGWNFSAELDVLMNDLGRMQVYLEGRTHLLKKNSPFQVHLASAIDKIASQSITVWINRKSPYIATAEASKIIGLRALIDPWDVKFMELLHTFRLAVSKANPADEGYSFCDYLLTVDLKDCLYQYRYFRERLRTLADNYIQCYPSRHLFPALSAEIESAFRSISTLYQSVHSQNTRTVDSDLSFLALGVLNFELLINTNLCKNHKNKPLLEQLRSLVQNLLRLYPIHVSRYDFVSLFKEIDQLVVEQISLLQPNQKNLIAESLLKLQILNMELFIMESLISFSTSTSSSMIIEKLGIFEALTSDDTKYLELLAELNEVVQGLRESKESADLLHSLRQLLHAIVFFKARAFTAELLRRSESPGSSLALVKDQVQTLVEDLSSFETPVTTDQLKWNSPDEEIIITEILQLARRTRLISYDDEEILKSLPQLSEDANSIKEKLRNVTPISPPFTCVTPPKVLESPDNDSNINDDFTCITPPSDQILSDDELEDGDFTCTISPKQLIDEILPNDGDDVMMDLEEGQEVLEEQLTKGNSKRGLVFIVGDRGVGKTTLAKLVYNNKNIRGCFTRSVWCAIPPVYQKRQLLLKLLSSIQGASEVLHHLTDDDLQTKVRNFLSGKRYLIVLEDMFNISAWDYLKNSFPDDNNGSRILITTLYLKLHLGIKPRGYPYIMREFSTEECWKLLEQKVFREGTCCPPQLLPHGMKIAQHFQGLPLAITLIAGLLRRSEMTPSWWEKISNCLCSIESTDDPLSKYKGILELSYQSLPKFLKKCFLYMGVFLGDNDIPVSKLLRLWMAEGFIQEVDSKILEAVAEAYLMELISRSMVMISKKGSDGKVKTCRLHDFSHDLCHLKAKETNFLQVVTRDVEPYASFPTSEDYQMEFQNKHKVDPVTCEGRRMSFNLPINQFSDSKPSGPKTRTLIFTATADEDPKCACEIVFICKNFKVLRVLDVECINMGVTFPDEIGLMDQLRYLAVSGDIRSIPASIAKLRNLEYLVVKGLRGTITLANVVWRIKSLRYLIVNKHVIFDLKGDDEHVGNLDNLVSFCTPSLYFEDATTINILKRMRNLLKLKCIFLESTDDCMGLNRFPTLEFLTCLESLNILYYGNVIHSGEFVLPRSLKKLTLSKFGLPWSCITKIGELPNLKVLKLLIGAIDGTKWEMKDGDFKELNFLMLEDLNIAEWNASSNHLPKLKQLVLRNCKDLMEIPQAFGCITSLEMIEVQMCGKCVEESAQRIGKSAEAIKVDISSA